MGRAGSWLHPVLLPLRLIQFTELTGLQRILVARSAQEIEQLAGLWQHLQAEPGATLFQSYRWNRLATEMFAREVPYLVAAETDNGAAIIPACFTANGEGLTFLGEALFDYRDVLSAGDEDALRLAWAELARLGLPLAFAGLRATSLDRWLPLEPLPWTQAPGVSSRDTSAEKYAAAHHKLDYEWRRLVRMGAELTRHAGDETTLVRWLYQEKSYQLAARLENVFADPLRIEFMVRAAAMEADRCELHCLRMGGEIIAVLLSFLDSAGRGSGETNIRRYYTTWFHPAWSRYSPGISLLYEVARGSLEQGIEVDLLTGEQPHKARLATRSLPLLRVQAGIDDVAALARQVALERIVA